MEKTNEKGKYDGTTPEEETGKEKQNRRKQEMNEEEQERNEKPEIRELSSLINLENLFLG